MEEQQELPQGWVWSSVGHVLTVKNGFAFQSTSYQPTGIPLVRQADLGIGKIDLSSAKCLPTHFEAEYAKFLVTKGDLLFGMSGSLGKISVYEEATPALQNQRVGMLQFHFEEVKPYIRYYFEEIQQYLAGMAKGVAVQNISAAQIESLQLPLPPLPEQHRIVAKLEELFSKLDAGVAAVRRTQALLKRYRQSVLHAAVTGELTRAWREAHPAPAETGAALLERIRAGRRAQWEAAQVAKRGGQLTLGDGWKSKYVEPEEPDTSELPELPEGWVWVSPEQIASQDRYSMAIGPFGSNLKVPDYTDEGVPLVFVREIKSGKFGGSKTKYVTPTKAEELRAHQVMSGDILITKMGEPPGDACLYPEGRPDAVITADCIKWTLSSSLMENKEFFVYAINSHLVRVQIAFITQGVAQQKVSLGRFKTIAVPLPPLDEQVEIVAEVERRLTVLDALSQTLTDELKRAERLRQSILHRAFTGRLVPQDATDEPAAALLARLRETPVAPAKTKAGRGRKAVAQQTTLGL